MSWLKGFFTFLSLLLALNLAGGTRTEHRRALVIDASGDETTAGVIDQLQEAFAGKGFLVTQLKGSEKDAGYRYEKWVRSIPTLGVAVIYYCGKLDMVQIDQRNQIHTMKLRGFEEVPPTRDMSKVRNARALPPPLSLERLSSQLSSNTARFNMVVIDCLGVHDKSDTGKSTTDLFATASGKFRGELYSAFYPGKAAFHPSLNPPEFGPFMAREMTRRLKNNGELPPEIPKLGYNVVPRDRKFVLQHEPAKVCSDPYKIEKGRFAGDQWVDRNGINFVWCPPGKFIMGDNRFEDAKETEVSLSKGFWIGKYEVLPSEGNFFNMGGRPHTKERRNVRFYPGVTGNVDYIADSLYNWNEFLISQGAGYEGWSYDLPSEAEWEHACRAGSKEGMPATDAQLGLYANHADKSLYSEPEPVHYLYSNRSSEDGFAHASSPSGYFRPNAWGLHDMHGNLAELCSNFYTAHIIGGTDPNDQSLPHSRASRHRITRGGAWCSPPEYLHAAHRNIYSGIQAKFTGMRLILRQGEMHTLSKEKIIASLEK